ncbi:hypothetical protein FQZ97_946090 [compost metagenome]
MARTAIGGIANLVPGYPATGQLVQFHPAEPPSIVLPSASRLAEGQPRKAAPTQRGEQQQWPVTLISRPGSTTSLASSPRCARTSTPTPNSVSKNSAPPPWWHVCSRNGALTCTPASAAPAWSACCATAIPAGPWACAPTWTPCPWPKPRAWPTAVATPGACTPADTTAIRRCCWARHATWRPPASSKAPST